MEQNQLYHGILKTRQVNSSEYAEVSFLQVHICKQEVYPSCTSTGAPYSTERNSFCFSIRNSFVNVNIPGVY